MATLYIIGNGFDLAHGLESSYGDFYTWSEGRHYSYDTENDYTDFITKLTWYVGKQQIDTIWNDFEKALGSARLDKAFSEIIQRAGVIDDPQNTKDIAHDLIEYDSDISGLANIQEIFAEWVKKIERTDIEPKFKLEQNDYYLTFNYTHVLEDIYDIEPSHILHIHGESNEPQSIVVGHNTEYKVADYITPKIRKYDLEDSIKQMVSVFADLKKDTKRILEQHQQWFDDLKDKGIDTIELYGLSFGEIDDVYFQEIKRQLPQAKWRFALHGNGTRTINIAKQKVEEFIDRINIDHTLCSAFWQDSIMSKEEMLFINNN